MVDLMGKKSSEVSVSIGDVYSYIQAPPELWNRAVAATRFRTKGYEMTDAYKRGSWDGFTYLSQKTPHGLRVPTGLVPQILGLWRDKVGSIDLLYETSREKPSPSVDPLVGTMIGLEGGLWAHQEEMVQSILSPVAEMEYDSWFTLPEAEVDFLYADVGIKTQFRLPGMGIWWSATGCHEKGQEILMYDGSLKKIDEIVIGDKLMGLCSSSRTVLSLCRGRQEMVRISPSNSISPSKWNPFVVNLDHVLSLMRTGKIVDVTVRDWCSWDETKKQCYKLFRSPVAKFESVYVDSIDSSNFTVEILPVDDYYGVTLDGDGRYLMGDFTVTHNSGKTEASASLVSRLGVPTLFIVYENTLVQQTANRFKKRLRNWLMENDIDVGVGVEGNLDKQFITVAGSSTLAAIFKRGGKDREDLDEFLQSRQLLILDEAHGGASKGVGN